MCWFHLIRSTENEASYNSWRLLLLQRILQKISNPPAERLHCCLFFPLTPSPTPSLHHAQPIPLPYSWEKYRKKTKETVMINRIHKTHISQLPSQNSSSKLTPLQIQRNVNTGQHQHTLNAKQEILWYCLH